MAATCWSPPAAVRRLTGSLLLAILAVGTLAIWLAAPWLFRAGIDRARDKGYLDRNTAS